MVSSSFDINILVNGNPGAEIVYTAPYSMYVEDPAQTLNHSHGKYYNMKHAADIAAGLDHARKPEETNLFLSIAVYDNRQNVFEIIKGAAVNVTV
jgi:hypothetical protein